MAAVLLPGTSDRTQEAHLRQVILVSSDPSARTSLRTALLGMRWQVREAGGAAEAMGELDRALPEALILDRWLPDIEVNEFAALVQATYPAVDLLRWNGQPFSKERRGPRRSELLAAVRTVADGQHRPAQQPMVSLRVSGSVADEREEPAGETRTQLPGMIGDSLVMLELGRMIRLVAPRDTTVLIEGPTGAGKELVALAIHELSGRKNGVLAVLNCAAIPETLLEAELFGHTRGAFTGATQSRVGRIEAADGGTLFLDEIGEMPLALQAKMLRFLECGEIQRVGDNVVSHVNVRVVAATHQPLEQRSEEGAFRLDLYHRLAVFPVEIPSLQERMDDLPALAEYFLDRFGEKSNRKRLTPDALEELMSYRWPGNVRELMHVLERATILAHDSERIERSHIRIRRRPRS